MMRQLWFRSSILVGATATALGIGGCGITASPSAAAPAALTVAPARGVVMGGQQPVAGVTLQLYQAGATGYGSAATPLGPPSYTNANGNFNLPAYTCTAGSQVYLVGTGGQPISNITNNNLALMVGLGTCGGADLDTFINVNELTTVASVWALAPFMSGTANIGSSSTNAAGLANAFAAINQVVNTANGTTPGAALPSGANLPTTEINTLGDILAQCVNSGGGTEGDGSACGTLFEDAPNAAGTVYPIDTITAMMNIARSPGRNVGNLLRIVAPNPVFQPALNVNFPPNDWTVAITYTGGGLSTPTSIAADATGAVWIANSGNSSVTKLSPAGAPISGSSGLSAPSAIAIDTNGNAWVANAGNNTVAKLNSALSSDTVYSGNGLNAPASIAIDGSGNIWVSNTGANPVSAFTGSGGVLPGSPYSGAGTSAPVSVAVTPK